MTRRCFSKDHHFKAEIVITPNEAYIPNVWVGRQQITSGKGRVSEERGNGGEDLTEKKTLRGRRRERLRSEGGKSFAMWGKRESANTTLTA